MAAISLWPDRWPAIAKQECIDEVEAAPPDQRAEVKFALPCSDCEMSTRCLNAKRKELGPLLYDREILTKPRTSESSLFPWELFEPLLRRDEQMVEYYLKPYGAEERYAVCSAWDLAWSERIGGDYLVKMTALLDRANGKRKLIDVCRWQKKTFDEQIELIEMHWGMYHDDLVVIEGDAAQRVWRQHLERNTAVPVMSHEASEKRDFALGVPGLLLKLEQGKWEFPYSPGTWHFEELRVFFAEAEAFGFQDDKLQGIGEHDDTVMAWWHLDWGLDRLVQPMGQKRAGVVTGKHI